jgi:adenylate kinase
MRKLTSRRICSDCGDNYNLADIRDSVYDMPPMLPKRPGQCDACDGKLIQRIDDYPDTVLNRLEIHANTEGKLLDFYAGRLSNFKVTRGVAQTPELLALIKSKL